MVSGNAASAGVSLEIGANGKGVGRQRRRNVIELNIPGKQVDGKDARITVDPAAGVTIEYGGTDDQQTTAQPTGANNFDENLAERLNSDARHAIAQFLLDGIEADRQSRGEWEETANQAANYLGIKLQDPTTSVSADGTVCQTIATCMLESITKLWSTARGELLPVSGPVKVRRDTDPPPTEPADPATPQPGQPPAQPTPDQQKKIDQDAIAQALETDMNHYLTVTDLEYYPDFSKMLFSRALIGNAFRKVYRDPLKRRPLSRWVMAQNLIVSNDCTHLSGAGRVTEIIPMRQSVMRRMQVKGHYLDIELVQPSGEVTETERSIADLEGIAPSPQLPADFQHYVYECSCELGSTAVMNLIGDLSILDKDETGKEPGYPLPYRVSIDRDSREVLEIRRNWKKGDEDHNARIRYVKYGFIPGLGFYDNGLIHLVGNPTQAATMLQRSGVDASLFANFPGGVFLKGIGSRQESTVLRPNPGTFIGMDAGGATKIGDIIQPMPYRSPDATHIALLNKFEGDVKRIAGTIELPLGEGRIGNTPVGTIMAYIEAIAQVPGAVHKDDHISQQQEYILMRELFAEDPSALIRGNKSPARQWEAAEEVLGPDLVPAADPNTPSQVHRLMKDQALVSVSGLPQFQGIANPRKIYRKVVQEITGEDPSEYEMPPAPPQQAQQDPRIVAAEIRAGQQQQSDQSRERIAQTNAESKATQTAAEAEQRGEDRQSEETRALMTLAGKAMDHSHQASENTADRIVDHAHHKDQMAQQAFAAPFAAPDAGAGGIADATTGPGGVP